MALEWLTVDLIVKVLRGSSMVCGALLVLAGVLGISKYDKLTEMFLQVDDPFSVASRSFRATRPHCQQVIVSVYLILFGIVVVAAELKTEQLLEQLKFLQHYPGRGAFFIL